MLSVGCLNADQIEHWAGIGTSGNYYYLFDGDELFIKLASKSIDGSIHGSKRYWDKKTIDFLVTEEGSLASEYFGENQIILYGGGWCFFSSQKPFKLSFYLPNTAIKQSLEKSSSSYYESQIKSVSSTSMLEENLVNSVKKYDTSGLLQTFIQNNRMGFITKWNHELIPWAEGEDGPGIGVTLDITYKEPTDHLLVINGYVDFGKMYLYKANNRIKEATFKSLDPNHPFEITHTFEDIVKIHEIDFPDVTNRIQMKIVSVYPGEKWNDTVITGMLTKNPDAEYYYNQFKNIFWNDATQYSDGLDIEWDKPPAP